MTHLKKSRKIVQTLHEAGFTAYYAGGWVRDLLLGVQSDEVDIATSASPEEIEALFPKTIAVGKAFGVIIVCFEGEQFEVTTFRKDHCYHDGRHPDGVDFTTAEKDASRRDFTINGLFFDPLTEQIYDYVEGRRDLEAKIIRAIGDPFLRFEEDKLRMIRAVRFAARLDFQIEPKTLAAIKQKASSLFPSVSMERIWQELTKMSAFPRFDQALLLLYNLTLFQTIFPKEPLITLTEFKTHLSYFPYYPPHCPTIIYLQPLLPAYTNEQLCSYLKTARRDLALLDYFQKLPTSTIEWVYFYAHEDFPLWLAVQAAKILPPKRAQFIKQQQEQQKKLHKHIIRVQNRTPLVTSAHLRKLGVEPGAGMGKLLKAAEEIAITEDLDDAEEVLKRLMG